MEQKITCSKCGKDHIKKDGKRKTENRGKIQRYKCLDCSYRFVIDDDFYTNFKMSINTSPHKSIKQRRWLQKRRFEFRMRLSSNKKFVLRYLYKFR